MADKKKKKQTPKKAVNKKTTVKKTTKATAAKKKPGTAPKSMAAKATKAAKPKTTPKQGVKKPVAKKATKATNQKAIKPDWDFENEKPKRVKNKKEEIIINIPRKSAAQERKPKNVTKQVTEQLPDNARLKTIHLHFRLD